MKTTKWLLVLVCAMLWNAAHADGKDFMFIDASNEYLYSIKKGTGHSISAIDGKLVFGGIIREDAKDGKIHYYKEYVNSKDCEIGYGNLYAYGLNGDFIGKLDWVKGGGNISSSIADFLCVAIEGAKLVESQKQYE